MGYDLQAVRGKAKYSANAPLMALLRAAILETGVRLDRQRFRTFDPTMNKGRVEGDLFACFCSNDGWLVTAVEAREIADKVEAALPRWVKAPKIIVPTETLIYVKRRNARGEPTEWGEAYPIDPSAPPPEAAEIGALPRTVELAEKFVRFCRTASKNGGFFVY